MFEDEEDEIWESLYENGHWEWDTEAEKLTFISDLAPSEEEYETSATLIHNVAFKDDIDLWEQQKFRKRLQRKTTDSDVIMLQDVKDVVLFTAPSSILSPAVINLLHLPTTERFLRALILCCQYYLQISKVMTNRTIELETKIRNDASEEIELKYREDLEDLRLLVANEYCLIILGGEEFIKYHHMGTTKTRSLTKKEAALFETMICIAIQIVWIALGRKHYNQIGKSKTVLQYSTSSNQEQTMCERDSMIGVGCSGTHSKGERCSANNFHNLINIYDNFSELEINRILKSDIYNSAEHKLNTKYLNKMNPRERLVLVGHCVRPGKKFNTRSPLINEVFCERNIGFRLYGLGALKYSGLSARLRYLESTLSQPEQEFGPLGISLGIIGLPRSGFDTILREIKTATGTSTSSASLRQSFSRTSRTSRVMSRKSTVSAAPKKIYPDIVIPEKGKSPESLPEHFPCETLSKLSCNNEQRAKWMRRILSKRKKNRP